MIVATGLSRDVKKLKLARELGADVTIDVEVADAVERVRDLTSGEGVDVVLGVTPMAHEPIRDALQAVRWGGTLVLAGLTGNPMVELPTDVIVDKALTIKGAYRVDARAYTDAIRLIESGELPLERLHMHTIDLEDVEYALQLLAGEVEGEDAIHVAIRP